MKNVWGRNKKDLSNEALSFWNFHRSNYFSIFYAWHVMLSECKCMQMAFNTKWPPPWGSVPLWQCLSQDTHLVKWGSSTSPSPLLWGWILAPLENCQSLEANLLTMLFTAVSEEVIRIYMCECMCGCGSGRMCMFVCIHSSQQQDEGFF